MAVHANEGSQRFAHPDHSVKMYFQFKLVY